MDAIEHTVITKDRLMDLERTVAALDTRLRTMQWGLQKPHAGSLIGRFRSMMRFRQGNEFMSTVCNQRVRSNTKVVLHDGPRA
ncbi:MAG: hypothetical protein H8K04_05950 [Nitrospira sp.]